MLLLLTYCKYWIIDMYPSFDTKRNTTKSTYINVRCALFAYCRTINVARNVLLLVTRKGVSLESSLRNSQTIGYLHQVLSLILSPGNICTYVLVCVHLYKTHERPSRKLSYSVGVFYGMSNLLPADRLYKFKF